MSEIKKIHYFEWARAIGALAIVLLHLFSCELDNNDIASVGALRSIAYSDIQIVFTRWAVPIFIMITGALLLNPEKCMPYRKLWSYIRRMLLVLATFGYLFCLMEVFAETRQFGPTLFIRSFLNLIEGNSWSHMWYIYALIGLYILTPALKAFVGVSSQRELRIALIVLFLITSVIPSVNAVMDVEVTSFITLPVYVFYYLFGYYAATFMRLSRGVVGVGAVAGGLMAVVVTLSILLGYGYADWAYANYSALIVIYACFVFLMFKRFCNVPSAHRPVVKMLANYSFGIYIIHPLFINLIYKFTDAGMLMTFFPVISEMALYLLVVGASVGCVWLLKRIPGVRSLI